jgi:hypothetical protein
MWNELGISGGTAIIILVFRHQVGSEEWCERSISGYYWKETC